LVYSFSVDKAQGRPEQSRGTTLETAFTALNPMATATAETPLIAIGGMRLSTEPDRDDARATAVLHATFEAGINFIDTADAYCRDATEAGHNERLIAGALAGWNGDRSRILLAIKRGLTRPHGHWVADGRARHLAAACQASRRALGVDRIHL
jgi:aryl-alcohol dehydrogenase-like predicted oxidoreductase